MISSSPARHRRCRRARRRSASRPPGRRAPPRPRAPARRRGSPAPSRRRRGAHAASSEPATSALPGPSAPISDRCCPARSEPAANSTSWPGVTVTTMSSASASSSELATPQPSSRATCCARAALTSQTLTARPRVDERPRGSAAVHARADHRRGRRIGARKRLGREHRGGAGAQRGHRARVEHRAQLARLGVRDEHHAAHGRQALQRVAGERGDPLQQRVARRRAPASRGSRRRDSS